MGHYRLSVYETGTEEPITEIVTPEFVPSVGEWMEFEWMESKYHHYRVERVVHKFSNDGSKQVVEVYVVNMV